jgi:hypothetical protein
MVGVRQKKKPTVPKHRQVANGLAQRQLQEGTVADISVGGGQDHPVGGKSWEDQKKA